MNSLPKRFPATEQTARCPRCHKQAKIVAISAKTKSRALACVCGAYIVGSIENLLALTEATDE